LRENLPVLQEVKDKAIVNGEDYPNHILIEGDNLHALTALNFTMKVELIQYTLIRLTILVQKIGFIIMIMSIKTIHIVIANSSLLWSTG
jgi:hypothetical protein